MKRRFDKAESRSIWAQSRILIRRKANAICRIRNVLKVNLNPDRTGWSGKIRTARAVQDFLTFLSLGDVNKTNKDAGHITESNRIVLASLVLKEKNVKISPIK